MRAPGLAVLTVQFKVGVARTEALVRIYDVLNANQDWLPRDLGTLPPIVKPKGIDDVPVLGVTLWSRDARSGVELERIAYTMEAELKRVPGAREVQTIGGPGRVVQVTLEPGRMRERGVDLMRLRQMISAANFGMPAGTVAQTSGSGTLTVETGEFLRSVDDVGDIIVGVNQSKPVYLREVAKIEAGAAQPKRYVWFSPGLGSSHDTTPQRPQGKHRRLQRPSRPVPFTPPSRSPSPRSPARTPLMWPGLRGPGLRTCATRSSPKAWRSRTRGTMAKQQLRKPTS